MINTRNFVHIHTAARRNNDPAYDPDTDTCHWCRTGEANGTRLGSTGNGEY